MANLAKLKRPSWWWFQARRCYSIPVFWWRFLNTRPFPDDFEHVDQVVEYGKQRRIVGFNRECIRAYIFWRLHRRYQCTSFIETGTQHGYTSAFVRRAFKTPVFTSELNNTRYLVSRAYLAWARQTKLSHSNSSEFLQKICFEDVIGSNPMFYLDAHWNEYMPLPDELATIGDRCEKAVILIDDFRIPWEPRFLYDGYPGVPIDLSTVQKSLLDRRKDCSVYLPNYSPDQDPTGKGIGFAIILMGQEKALSTETFPYDLVSEAPN